MWRQSWCAAIASLESVQALLQLRDHQTSVNAKLRQDQVNVWRALVHQVQQQMLNVHMKVGLAAAQLSSLLHRQLAFRIELAKQGADIYFHGFIGSVSPALRG
jgi:hypothetical protein